MLEFKQNLFTKLMRFPTVTLKIYMTKKSSMCFERQRKNILLNAIKRWSIEVRCNELVLLVALAFLRESCIANV